MKKFTYGVGLMVALLMPQAEAATREIRALFQPDPSQPGKNAFVNKTPNSGYCADYPAQCADNGMFSIRIPVRFNSTVPIIPNNPLALRVPNDWRRLTVTNQDTQETETVEVRIIGIGSTYVLSDSAADLVGVPDIREGHQKLWTSSSWVYAPAPCLYSGVGYYGPKTYGFFWKTPVEGGVCTKVAAYRIPSMGFDTLDFAYELRTPNPLGMSSGLYTGTMSYTIGFSAGDDFSMGFMMQPDDRSLTLDFVLDVQHTLKVDLPPGGDKVVLEPEGGWQRWIEGGHKPARIYRDQPFYISASSRFKVMLECEESFSSEACNLRSPTTGNRAYVNVKISLPPGFESNGAPITRRVLRHRQWSASYQPTHYVDRKTGSLHFEMPKAMSDLLLKPGMNDTFIGTITVIWDSEA